MRSYRPATVYVLRPDKSLPDNTTFVRSYKLRIAYTRVVEASTIIDVRDWNLRARLSLIVPRSYARGNQKFPIVFVNGERRIVLWQKRD